MMFNEVPFLERFASASDAGFQAVEFLFPYEYSPEEVQKRAQATGIEIVLFNLPPGDWSAGERGIACIPGREGEFRKSVELGLKYATQLGVRRLHAMAGIPPRSSDPAACRATYIANLKYAAEQLVRDEITLVLEAINTRDMPFFFVSRQEETNAICEAVGAPNVKMQMDLYHMQVMEGDLATTLKRYMHRCGHVQVAGCPERNEPDTGEIRYEYLFRLLDELNYTGWIGCEYRPKGKTSEGLGWFHRIKKEGENRV
jgi:hydroxypyruvate isomerase